MAINVVFGLLVWTLFVSILAALLRMRGRKLLTDAKLLPQPIIQKYQGNFEYIKLMCDNVHTLRFDIYMAIYINAYTLVVVHGGGSLNVIMMIVAVYSNTAVIMKSKPIMEGVAYIKALRQAVQDEWNEHHKVDEEV